MRRNKIIFIKFLFYSTIVLVSTIIVPFSGFNAKYFALLSGNIGLLILAWNFIFGTRMIIGLFTNNLNAVLTFHKNLGKYGSLIIFSHPLAMLVYYQKDLIWLIKPDFSSDFNTWVGLGRVALFLLLIIWISSALIRNRITYKFWKYLHFLSYPTLILALIHTVLLRQVYDYPGISGAGSFYDILIALLIFAHLLRFRTILGLGKVGFIIIENRQIAEGIHLIKLQPKTKVIWPQAGQYLYLSISKFALAHPFSVVAVTENGEIYLCYKIFGEFTRKLSRLPKQTELLIDGAYGVFLEEYPKDNAVFIAGGIGVTPFISSVIKHSSDQNHNLTMFYAAKNPNLAVFASKLSQSLGNNFLAIYSEYQGELAPNSTRGFISKELIKKQLVLSPNQYNYYICGPKALLVNTKNILKELGVPKAQIFIEDFSF